MLALALLASCQMPQPRPFAPTAVVRGDHFRILAGTGSEQAARQALAAAEASWPHAVEIFGAPAGRFARPRDIYLYETEEEYAAVEASLTKGRFRKNLAFCHYPTQTAHVVIQPRLDAGVTDRWGLPIQTIRLVAHEALHLAASLSTPTAVLLPDWLDEGAATWTEQRVLASLGLASAEASDPWTGSYWETVKQLQASGRLPTVATILWDETRELSGSESYALYRVFFAYLHEHRRDDLRALLESARRLPADRSFSRRLRDLVDSIWPEPNMARLDEAFRAHVDALTPEWIERGRSLAITRKGWVHAAFPRTDATAVRGTPEALPYRVVGALEFLGEDGELFVIVGHDGERQVRIAFSHEGRFEVQRVQAGKRSVLYSAPMTPSGQVAFRIDVADSGIAVALSGGESHAISCGEGETAGTWGLGARRGSAGIWRQVSAFSLDDPLAGSAAGHGDAAANPPQFAE